MAEKIDITDIAPLLSALDHANDQVDVWKHTADTLKARIKDLMGDATLGQVDGRDAISYDYTGQFNAKRFATEQPDATRRYTHTVVVAEIDTAKLAAEEPDLYRRYRARRFLRKHNAAS